MTSGRGAVERATEGDAQWPPAPHGSMPYGRSLRTRRTESPASARSGASATSERNMLHTVLMVNSDGQIAVRADCDTFENRPLSLQQPHMHGECL
eukprot:8206893-Pyramimonas_sp.AAC.1